ncbi:thymidine kinase [Streptomyces sp. 769]|uniref:thymidine kinase n=1 Tax=Streptomyces sp. 769 TaxID=1262452 RepID=UPI00057F01A1|nr:thymidine kinase [Streptomyces sp. 769]AJC53964.1 thymidine kinase [Streptomyces sp. 769]
MPELKFIHSSMNTGKSTLVLQEHHSRGGLGLLYTGHSRKIGHVTSRLGIEANAAEITADLDLYDDIRATNKPCYVLVDEAQFVTAKQVGQLAAVVDQMHIDVYCYGLLTDFTGHLFAGSQRLVELADRIETAPVSAYCWCGKKASHNARTENGVMVHSGDQVSVGDIGEYKTLCRHHHMAGLA